MALIRSLRKTGGLCLIAFVFAISNAAHATVPFSRSAFEAAQQKNEKIILHFHADWCPTCKAQAKTFEHLEAEGALKGLTLMRVDYDKEKDFKKELSVTSQSTLVTFFGAVETGRVTGITSDADLRGFVKSKLSDLTLQDQLRLMKEASAAKIPPEVAKIMQDELAKLKKTQIENHVLKVGQTMPNFKLNDATGKPVDLKSLLKKGPVVVTFYRGSWCPYCNAQLSDLQKHMAEFKAKGATLVAITPEKPDMAALTAEKKKLEFPILYDEGNKLADKTGLVFKLSPELKAVYTKFGIDLEKDQGNADWKLPIPASFVLAKTGKVIFSFVDADYTNRADTEKLIAAIKP